MSTRQVVPRFWLTSSVAALSVTFSLTALGEPSSAESLFLQARADMKAGRLTEACPRFQQSFELLPAPGTLLNWGICEELMGHPVQAWTKLESFISQVPADDPRVGLAKSHLAQIETQLGWLELKLADDAPAGSALWLDGELVESQRMAAWLPLSPGQHRLELRHPTRGVLRGEDIVLRATERQTRTLAPPPQAASESESPAATLPPRAPVPTAAPRSPHDAHEPSRPLRNASYASGGIAAGALATSLVFGGLSLQAKNTVSRHCDGRWCDPTGARAAEQGARYVALANVALVVGGVAALTSGSLFWASMRDRVELNVTPRAASVGYRTSF